MEPTTVNNNEEIDDQIEDEDEFIEEETPKKRDYRTLFSVLLIVITVLAFVGGGALSGNKDIQKMLAGKTTEKVPAVTPYPTYANTPAPLPTSELSPTPTIVPGKAIVILDQSWNKTTEFSDPNVDITFSYPSALSIKTQTVEEMQKQLDEFNAQYPDYKRASESSEYRITLRTPQYNPVDWQKNSEAICENNLGVTINKFANPKNISLYDFLADHYKSYAGSGYTAHFDEFKKGMKDTAQPKSGSYSVVASMGETDNKFLFFEHKNAFYQFIADGGCGTGDGYRPPAERTFDKIIGTIVLK